MISRQPARSDAAIAPRLSQDHAYRPDIDGLRAIAVLAVVLYHVGGIGVSGGFGGVDVFFVISGFLITSIIQREIDAGTFSLLNFYERRIRRIFPALAAVAIVSTAIAAVLLLPEDFKEYGKSLRGLVTISSNYYFLRTTGYFDAAAIEKPLLHTWSLSVEEQFYVVFPILLLALWRFGRTAAILGITLLAAASFLASIQALENVPARAFFATPGRVWELFAGVLTALLAPSLPVSRLTRELFAAAGLALIAFGYFAYSDITPFPGPAALVFCLGAALIISAGTGGGGTIVGRVLSVPPLRGIGLISYSVYLWHWPLIVFVHYRFPHWFADGEGPEAGLSTALTSAGLVAASLALGYLSWRFIEQPFRQRSGTRAQRPVFIAFLSLTAALIAVSLFIIKRQGLPERWPQEVNEMLKHRERPESEVCRALKDFGLWPKDSCLVGASGAMSPDTIVWGDSHALRLIDGIEAAVTASNRSVIVATLPGCPPLVGVTLHGRSRDVPCRALAAAVLTSMVQNDVRKIVMIARWAYYAEGIGHGMGGGTALKLSPDGLSKNPAIFAHLFEYTVRQLSAMGREIVIVGPIPEHRFHVAQTLARAVAWRQTLPSELPRSVFAKRQQHVLPLLERLAALPGVRIVYPDRYLCAAETCRYAMAAEPLYVDGNHLSLLGIKLLAPLIEEALAKPHSE